MPSMPAFGATADALQGSRTPHHDQVQASEDIAHIEPLADPKAAPRCHAPAVEDDRKSPAAFRALAKDCRNSAKGVAGSPLALRLTSYAEELEARAENLEKRTFASRLKQLLKIGSRAPERGLRPTSSE